MKRYDQKPISARSPIARRGLVARVVYYLLNILLFPVTVIGYILLTIPYFAGRKSGVSGMAQAPLTARWYQHHLGTRLDEPANRLLNAITPIPLAIPLGYGTIVLASRVSGFVPQSFRYPYEGEITLSTETRARQTFFDSVVNRYLPAIAQFVILGAGFDTRALNLPRDMPVRSFEIDTPKTQAVKRQLLAQTGIDSSRVTFVSADFEKEDWLTRLTDAGFDPSQPALFIWEGVIMYLDKEAARDTLRKIASTASGTVIAFDYFTREVLESQTLFMRTVREFLNAGGEPLKFGIDSKPPSRDHLAELLQSCGFSLVEQRTLGQEDAVAEQPTVVEQQASPQLADSKGTNRAWGGFATAIVK